MIRNSTDERVGTAQHLSEAVALERGTRRLRTSHMTRTPPDGLVSVTIVWHPLCMSPPKFAEQVKSMKT